MTNYARNASMMVEVMMLRAGRALADDPIGFQTRPCASQPRL
jgi:hypothetical protein